MSHLIIPDFQPVAFPAPLWLLKALLVAGFYLHVLPMNVSLAGPFLAGIYLLLGKGRPDHYTSRIGHALAVSLPFFVSLAITQGIVPLLFLQLVYGPLYYTSSILMGAPWILLLVLLLTGYYGLYLYKLKRHCLGGGAAWLLMGVSVLFAIIGFLFSNNMTLMLHPETWHGMLQAPSAMGRLNLAEPTLLSRYLHFLLAGLAVTGLAVGCFGLYWRKRDTQYSQWLIRQGAGLYTVITLLQFGVGSWFLMALSRPLRLQFMSGDPAGMVSFMGSMALSLISLVAMVVAMRSGGPLAFRVGLTSGLGVVLLMSVMRHLLREYTVQGFLHPEMVPVHMQWDLLAVFSVSAIGLIAYLTWLVRVVWQGFHATTHQEVNG